MHTHTGTPIHTALYIEQLNNTISNAKEKQFQKRKSSRMANKKRIDKNKQIIEIQDYFM